MLLKTYIILGRRFLALVFLLLVLFVLIFYQFSSSKVSDKNGDTHKKRIDYINSLNYEVNEETVTSEQIIIPYVFSNVYNNYNVLQNKAGYNLLEYKGKTITKYCYEISNLGKENYYLNLLVFDGKIIGGDICSTSIKGEMLPLLSNK